MQGKIACSAHHPTESLGIGGTLIPPVFKAHDFCHHPYMTPFSMEWQLCPRSRPSAELGTLAKASCSDSLGEYHNPPESQLLGGRVFHRPECLQRQTTLGSVRTIRLRACCFIVALRRKHSKMYTDVLSSPSMGRCRVYAAREQI